MVLVSQQIPNLIGGISQQPAALRRVNQCEDAVNVYSDPVSGIKKRPGSQFVSSISDTTGGFWGSIERDEVEKYIFNISTTGIKVWDSDGVERVVTTPGDYQYLESTNDYKYITIADTTFIVNPTRTVTMGTSRSPLSTADGLIFIRAIDAELVYTVSIITDTATTTATYTAPMMGTLSTETAAASIRDQLNAATGITAESKGPVVRYTVDVEHDLEAFTSRGSDYITAIPGVIENFGDLPEVGFDGVIVRVSQDPTTIADDYYVRFEGDGNGVWVETIKPDTENQLNPTTMPHTLTRQANGSFIFDVFNWTEKSVGDEVSNPNPSFVGEKIANIFFERNRIGFLSDINCILSESSGLSNFFRTTVSTIVDSDPIDLSISGRQVDKLKTAIGVKDGILMFSEEAQFLLNVGDADILSPETASITTISSYRSNTSVEPKRVGSSILFITRRDLQSGVREYLYETSRDFTDSASVTNHVPRLIPANINLITGSSTENIVFVTGEDSDILYVYQYLFSGNEKVVSSWVKWSFGGALIRHAVVFDNYLYLVLDRDSDLVIERVPLSNSFTLSSLSGEVCLDEYLASEGSTRTFDGTNTVFTIPKKFRAGTPNIIITGPPSGSELFKGDVIVPDDITYNETNTLFTFAGDLSTMEFIVGSLYDFLYEFSTPYVNLGDGDVEIEGRLQVRNMSLYLHDTGNCSFRVIYGDEPADNTSIFIEDVVDWSLILDMSTLESSEEDSNLDDLSEIYSLQRAFPDSLLDTRLNQINYVYRVPIMCENTEYRLRIESGGWQPVNISKAQWEALYHKRSRLNG